MTTDRARIAPGVAEGGQFTTTARSESSVTLPVGDVGARRVSMLVAAGRLSPAARDMDPREAIDQLAQAEALTFADHNGELQAAGLHPRAAARDIVTGDTLVLDGESREVNHVVVAGRAVEFELDGGGSLVLGTSEQVEFEPGPGRCGECGAELDGDSWDGRCGSCVDAD